MVKVTLDVPEALLGDVYIAVGRVLRIGQDELDESAEPGEAPEQLDPGRGKDGDEPAAQA